ncbi:MAG: hypothetical protein L6Q99_03405 [Planctomycetes bacterium]|nr:hypothetical protein [Planctomycetota bacterium]
MIAAFLLVSSFVAPVSGPVRSQAPAPQVDAEPTTAGPKLDLRVSPFVDLYFMVRHAAASKEQATPAELAAAAAVARELDAALGGPLGWGPIEGLLPRIDDAVSAKREFATLPATLRTRSGGTLELRANALKLADALAVYEPVYRSTLAAERAKALVAARRELEGTLLAKQTEAFESILGALEFSRAELVIPVYLVLDAPEPGAVTQRDDAGRGVCFVSLGAHAGTLLHESILHEALHALDVASPTSVLTKLRAKLEAAGIGPREREWRDVPHTLMFVQAAETVRRVLAPEHRAYGDVAGYYAKVRSIADLELALWPRRLAGELSTEVALDELVRAVVALRDAR